MTSPRWLLATLTVLTALGVAGLGIIAMPAGGPLADWCRVDGRLDVVRAVIVISPLLGAAALSVVRWQTLRDVRPERLLAHGIAIAALTGLLAAALALMPGRAKTLPDATLIDQEGQPFALATSAARPFSSARSTHAARPRVRWPSPSSRASSARSRLRNARRSTSC